MTNDMKEPLISVVVPVFNCEKYVYKCLTSLIEQTFQDFEIVIVNDGSTDRTETLCRGFLKRYSGKIHYYYQTNKGAAAARNAGLELARGKYISFLDGDDCWENIFLEYMLKELESCEYDIVVCYSYRLEFKSNILIKKSVETWIDDIDDSKDLHKQFLREDLIGGPSRTLCKRSILSEIGGYDERFPLSDCWDLWIRFFQKKRRVSIVRLPLYYYHVRDDGSNITRRAKASDGTHEYYILYFKYKSLILKDGELKKAYSEYFWNCALKLYSERTNFVWILYFVLLSQRLHFSIFDRISRFLWRNNGLL